MGEAFGLILLSQRGEFGQQVPALWCEPQGLRAPVSDAGVPATKDFKMRRDRPFLGQKRPTAVPRFLVGGSCSGG